MPGERLFGKGQWNLRGLGRVALELPDAVVVADAEGHLVWANPAAERIFGLAVDDIVGLSALDFLHPDDVELAAAVALERAGQDRRLPHRAPVVKTPTGWSLSS